MNFHDCNKNCQKTHLEKFLEELYFELKKNGEFRIKGLGKFRIKSLNARMGRNPKTGEAVQIPARKKVRFAAAKAFKDAVL